MVNRCICSAISFDEVLEIAKEEKLSTIEELREKKVCCVNCKLCEPYIKKVLSTGQTIFNPDQQ